MKGFWYNVTFVRGSSRRSYAVSAACIGNAKAAAWCRLEDTEGTREGWSLVMVSEFNRGETSFAKAGTLVACIKDGAKLSGKVISNDSGNLLIQWRDFPHPISYTPFQIMDMGITTGEHTNTPVQKKFEPSEQSDWSYRRAEAGYGQ
jgi:hypothetical protein